MIAVKMISPPWSGCPPWSGDRRAFLADVLTELAGLKEIDESRGEEKRQINIEAIARSRFHPRGPASRRCRGGDKLGHPLESGRP